MTEIYPRNQNCHETVTAIPNNSLNLTDSAVARTLLSAEAFTSISTGQQIESLGDGIALFQTSIGVPLVAPTQIDTYRGQWPEAKRALEHLSSNDGNLNTVLVSPAFRVKENSINVESNSAEVPFEVLRNAISAAMDMVGVHDYDDIKAELLANSRRSVPHIVYDSVVILGAASLPEAPKESSPAGQSRVQAGIDLFHSGLCAPLILSGGNPRPETVGLVSSEAALMEQLIRSSLTSSLPQSREPVLKEEFSRNTIENFVFVVDKILEKNGLRKPLIITSDYHVNRAEEIARWIGGTRYRFRFFGSRSPHISEQEAKIIARDELLLQKYLRRTLLDSIPAGDMQSILARIKAP